MRLCHVCGFLVVPLILFEMFSASAEKHEHDQNVGTVLFEKSESFKRCWTVEDFLAVNSRRMFQDLLPKINVINHDDDGYIDLLMDYFHICLASVQKLSIGKTRHLMLKALADTMGGYLQVYILPVTRQSYYAGNIKYHNAKKLFEIYEELKLFLHTNGIGWLPPHQSTKHPKIPPIVITPSKSSLACNGLITYDPKDSTNGEKKEVHKSRRRRRYLRKRDHPNNHHNEHNKMIHSNRTIIIPLPYLDDEREPNSVILPFKENGLLSLYSEKSAFAIAKYYVASVKCIMSRTKAKEEVDIFNRALFSWLQLSVRPHLETNKWYPAFGGILRIFATLESLGITKDTVSSAKGNTLVLAPGIGMERIVSTTESLPLWYKDGGVTFGTLELVSIAAVSALLVWLLVGLSLVCYRFLMRNSKDCQPCKPRPKNFPLAMLYKNKDYCEPKTCPSAKKREQKRMLKNFRNWCKNRFKKYSSRYENPCADEERYLACINYLSKDTVIPRTNTKACQKRRRSKSSTASPIASSRDRVSYRHRACYSTDGSLSTNSDSPAKPR